MGSFNWGAAAGSLLGSFGGAGGLGSTLGLSPGLSTALGTIGTTLSAGFTPGATVQQKAQAAIAPSVGVGAPALMPRPGGWRPEYPQLPGAAGPAGSEGRAGPVTNGGPTTGRFAKAIQAGQYVEMARKARRAWDAWSGSRAATEVQDLDLLTLGQVDDREMAKLAVKHGVIPAYSDLGTALQMAGAKITKRRVKMSDGTTVLMEVITAVGAKKRRRKNYATKAGIRNAGRCLRQMGQHVRTYKTLARLGAKIDRTLSPKRTAAAGAVRRITRKRK